MLKLIKITVVLIVGIYVFTYDLYSQAINQSSIEKAYEIVKAKYGSDPVLVNGKYFEDIYRYDLGHPYFNTDEFLPGMILAHNKVIGGLELKYNIFNQSIVVSYKDADNSLLIFIPPTEFISGFSIDGNNFSRYNFSSDQSEFCQEIFVSQEITFVYRWTKRRYDSYHNKYFKAYKYSQGYQELYTIRKNIPYLIKSNKSFIKTFKEVYHEDILNYIKTHQINLKKINTQELGELGAFCDNLLRKTHND